MIEARQNPTGKSPIVNPAFQSLIPPPSSEEVALLEASIRCEGCRDALVTWNGVLLDGHNRLEICKKHNVKFTSKEISLVDEDAAKIWIIQNQFGRRNIAPFTRVELALKLEPLLRKKAKENQAKGGKQKVVQNSAQPPDERKTRVALAKIAGVSHDTIAKGKLIAEHADETTKKLLRRNQVSVHRVAAQIKNVIQRSARAKSLSATQWPEGKFRVIYADPCWSYNDKRLGTTEGGGATGTYDTMSLEAICKMKVRGLALEDSVLFLWITSPLLPDGLTVMEKWGFSYKASFIWDKVQGFNGHYNDVRHEILLLGTRGSCLPETSSLPDSVLSIKKHGHSKKPEEFAALIDRLYPSGPRLELFARNKRKNWTSWGNQLQ